MDDLVTWLRAQIDEDARIARAGVPFGNPRRLLREVESKRRLLDETLGELQWADSAADGEWNHPQDAAGDFLRILALPYTDRPGYQEEWKP